MVKGLGRGLVSVKKAARKWTGRPLTPDKYDMDTGFPKAPKKKRKKRERSDTTSEVGAALEKAYKSGEKMK